MGNRARDQAAAPKTSLTAILAKHNDSMTKHRIPVRVGTQTVSTRPVYPEKTKPAEQAPREAPERDVRGADRVGDSQSQPVSEGGGISYSERGRDERQTDWRDRTLRLQAEMDNYRKRQRRIAQEEAQAGQERLLHDMLDVADNLERTLAATKSAERSNADALRKGIELTQDQLLRILNRHGVERFVALGKPFDPTWHEAVHVVSARAMGVEPGTVVKETQSGYRRRDAAHGERLFRPAQVVVAN
jgi:molecular chaperone GrpE